jgi:alpha-beta hydrolase superfamily lysophospholipase
MVRWILVLVVLLFAGINVILYNHAYHFTHFAPAGGSKTGRPEDLSPGEKLSVAFTGVRNPKPVNALQPDGDFETVRFRNQYQNQLEGWLIRTERSQGTVILFHGYTSTKSQLLSEAEAFRQMGFSTLLVDMSGHGGSAGTVTTVGYTEAADVVAAYQFAKKIDDTIILYGVSMGAAAILRAVAVQELRPAALVLECPFGSMVQAVRNRFRLMHLPDFPLAEMLVFWGGVQNDYPAFAHNPVDYARQVQVPVLLMYGLRDRRVVRSEVDEIYRNLPGPKEVVYFEELEHESYLRKQPYRWKAAVNDFLKPKTLVHHDL